MRAHEDEMSECQKVSMSKGITYARTCPACGLGPCKLGYPNWYIPRPGTSLEMPRDLPKLDPSQTRPFSAQEEIEAIKIRLIALENRG